MSCTAGQVHLGTALHGSCLDLCVEIQIRKGTDGQNDQIHAPLQHRDGHSTHRLHRSCLHDVLRLKRQQRVHVLTNSAADIGGFDVLQTVTLMAQAQGLPETAGIETHTGAKGFRNTPVWAEHLLTDTEKTTVFTGNAKQAIATFPRRVNVAVATSLATTGPEITGVTMHSVPGWVGDDHCITAEIEGVKAVVDICSSTSAIAGWSAVSLLRNLASPVCFY